MNKLIYRINERTLTRLKLLIIALSMLLTIALGHRVAKAITMRAYALSELQNTANLMIKGQIKAISFQRVNGRLVTIYEWKVIKVYKQEVQVLNPIRMLLPGGVKKGLEQIIPGVPKLDINREYFAFLKCGQESANICHPIGYGQGLWQQVEQTDQLSSKTGQAPQPSLTPELWYSLTEQVHWLGSAPQHRELSLMQLIGKEPIKDGFQHHLPLN